MPPISLPLFKLRLSNQSCPTVTLPPVKNQFNFAPSVKLRSLTHPYLITFVSGLVMGLTPAPLGLWWLAWFALAPLWILVVSQKAKSSLLLGLLWGLGYHGTVLVWITGLHPLTWMGLSWLTSVAIALFCWLFVTLWGAIIPTIWAGVMARLGPMPIGLRLLIGTGLWCGLEWLWTQSPLWWTSLALTQSPANLIILHLGQLSGPTAVIAPLVIVNGLVAEVLVVRPKLNPKAFWRLCILPLAVFLVFHLVGWSLHDRPLVNVPESALKVGIIQGNVPTRIKLTQAGIEQAIAGYTDGYRTLVDQGVEAVLTPEGAFPVVWTDPARWPTAFDQALTELHVPVWLGSFGARGNNITQSLFTLTGPDQIYSRYDKVKVVPLGEYIPFPEVLGKLFSRLSSLKSEMVPGLPGQQVDTPFGRAIAGICFDSVFAHLFQAQAAAGGQFILTASNNDPYSAVMMAQHHAQDVMRAIETDRWAVRATNTGYSGIVDPHGQTRWQSGVRVYQLHADTIYRRTSQTPYVRWGDWLTPLLVGVAAIAGLLNYRLKR
jgi:apolipoprotein N-acyltransferase